jgi:hypothetical protein
VDCRSSSCRTVAARLFWSGHQPKVSPHWELDSHAARYCGHSYHLEPPWGDIVRQPTREDYANSALVVDKNVV